MAGFGPDANAVAERRRWMGPMRYSISLKRNLALPLSPTLTLTLTPTPTLNPTLNQVQHLSKD